jgi:uncharacterized protein with ATP-grasp and redox domains
MKEVYKEAGVEWGATTVETLALLNAGYRLEEKRKVMGIPLYRYLREVVLPADPNRKTRKRKNQATS